MSAAECKLILVRHAATNSNLQRPPILQGQRVDHSLSDLGRRQADALAGALQSEPLAAVYSSPLVRAVETAEAVARPRGLEVIRRPGLEEIDVGAWEACSWETIRERWPVEYAAFSADEASTGYYQGENFHQLRDRADSAIRTLLERHLGETILVVSHNVVNRVLLASWLGLPLATARRLPQNNAGYSVAFGSAGKLQVRTINAAGHLSGLLPPE